MLHRHLLTWSKRTYTNFLLKNGPLIILDWIQRIVLYFIYKFFQGFFLVKDLPISAESQRYSGVAKNFILS